MQATMQIELTKVLGRTKRGKLEVQWPDGATGHIGYLGYPTARPACCSAENWQDFQAACRERFSKLLDEDFIQAEIARLEDDRVTHEAEQDRLDKEWAEDRKANPPPSFEEFCREAFPTADDRIFQGLTGRSCLDVYQAHYPAVRRRERWPKEKSNAVERLRQAL